VFSQQLFDIALHANSIIFLPLIVKLLSLTGTFGNKHPGILKFLQNSFTSFLAEFALVKAPNTSAKNSAFKIVRPAILSVSLHQQILHDLSYISRIRSPRSVTDFLLQGHLKNKQYRPPISRAFLDF
jgi:hypothetical protein